MLEIRTNVLYSRSDLAQLLEGSGLDADTFIAKIKPRKVFKMLWLGEDILHGIRTAPAQGAQFDTKRPSRPDAEQPGRQRLGRKKRIQVHLIAPEDIGLMDSKKVGDP